MEIKDGKMEDIIFLGFVMQPKPHTQRQNYHTLNHSPQDRLRDGADETKLPFDETKPPLNETKAPSDATKQPHDETNGEGLICAVRLDNQ